MEYKLLVEHDGAKELIRDPLNPNVSHDPYGTNSVCRGAGYETPVWAPDGPTVRFHIGLEDVDDLIGDLERGLAALAADR